MKRPQGFDGRQAQAPAPQAPIPAAPAPADRDLDRDRREEPRAVTTMTGPVPIARPRDESPYAALPTNREITKAVREARRERKRIERGEVRRFTKRSRRRRLAWIAAAAMVAALVLGVVAVAFSPLLALRHIDVVGASRLDPKAIVQKLDDQVGTPLPLLDQAAISADLAAFPLIRSYTLESHPPDTLVIRIVERQPLGVIRQGNAYTLVDAAKGGCAIIKSDDPDLIQRLNQEAAAALAAGRAAGLDISEAHAISWITLNPARALGIDNQTGSLEPGKRADVVVWDHDPFSVYARAQRVWIDGAVTYDIADPRFQAVSDFELGQGAAQ